MNGLADLAGGISKRGFRNPLEMLAENNTSVTVHIGGKNVSYKVIGYDPASGFIIGERSNGVVEFINTRFIETIIPEESAREQFK